jgi:FlaA1/EpsC-like NDP-sugar epimerase
VSTNFRTIFDAPRSKKRFISLLIDSIFVFSAFWLSLVLRIDSLSPLFQAQNWLLLSCLLPVTLMVFVTLGLYKVVLRFIGAHAIGTIVTGTIISTVLLVVVAFFAQLTIPRTMPIIYAWLLIFLVGGSRIMLKVLVSRLASLNKQAVCIYGAGSAGRQLAPAIGDGDE